LTNFWAATGILRTHRRRYPWGRFNAAINRAFFRAPTRGVPAALGRVDASVFRSASGAARQEAAVGRAEDGRIRMAPVGQKAAVCKLEDNFSIADIRNGAGLSSVMRCRCTVAQDAIAPVEMARPKAVPLSAGRVIEVYAVYQLYLACLSTAIPDIASRPPNRSRSFS
jgi:hypothetical protein